MKNPPGAEKSKQTLESFTAEIRLWKIHPEPENQNQTLSQKRAEIGLAKVHPEPKTAKSDTNSVYRGNPLMKSWPGAQNQNLQKMSKIADFFWKSSFFI